MPKWIELSDRRLLNLEALSFVNVTCKPSIIYNFIGCDEDYAEELFNTKEECNKRYEEIKRMLMGCDNNE